MSTGFYCGCFVAGFNNNDETKEKFIVLSRINFDKENTEEFSENMDTRFMYNGRMFAHYKSVSERKTILFDVSIYRKIQIYNNETKEWMEAKVIKSDRKSDQFLFEWVEWDGDTNLGFEQQWFHIDDSRIQVL